MRDEDLKGVWELTADDGSTTTVVVDESFLNQLDARIGFEDVVQAGLARKLTDEEAVVINSISAVQQEERDALRQWFSGNDSTDPGLQGLRAWMEQTQTGIFFRAPEHVIDESELDFPHEP